MEGLRFSPVFPIHAALMVQLHNRLCNCTASVYDGPHIMEQVFPSTKISIQECKKMNEIMIYSSVVTLNCILRSDFRYANIARKCNF